MSRPPSLSPVDEAFRRFRALRSSLPQVSSPTLSEADTRAKLVDPIFRDVLGWPEAEIRREKPISKGYADYVLGAAQPWLLIEAKRSYPRYSMKGAAGARYLDLGGPHLHGDKKVRPALEQAHRYAIELGAKAALLTNGSQFLAFRPYTAGRPWLSSKAILWHSWEDIGANFSDFFELFSLEAICSGRLLEALTGADSITSSLHRPVEHIVGSDAEFVRNPFWEQIARVFGPLLADPAQDTSLQREIIENCYVPTPLSDSADKELNSLIRDEPPPFLANAGLQNAAATKKSSFAAQFERDVEARRSRVYLLTGGVGSGKTTFLKRFALVTDQAFVEKYCVWLHVDFLPLGNPPEPELDTAIRKYAYSEVLEKLNTAYPELLPRSGDEYRALFAEEISASGMTLLHGFSPDSPEYIRGVNSLVHDLSRDKEQVVTAVLRGLTRRGLRCVLILDNTDQLGEQFQERLFLFSQELSRAFRALCMVSLREEKFFAAYRRGIFDAYGDRRFHIGSPALSKVLDKRLRYGHQKLRELIESGEISVPIDERTKLDRLISFLIRSVSEKNANIVRMLACVSNGDMRYALDMFSSFLRSGNTNIEKILAILEKHGAYTVPFHEFAKSAILGSRRYYRGGVSRVLNVFGRTERRDSSNLTMCRILARLCAASGRPSSHGEGFLETTQVLREFRESFGTADDLIVAAGELLRRGLLESEPPRVAELEQTVALRVTAAGMYYWRYLVRSFAYVDLVYVDTPIVEAALARKLATMATTSDMTVRVDRVRLFLEYLARAEREELLRALSNSGPFTSSLVSELQEQVEKEISYIKKRLALLPEDL